MTSISSYSTRARVPHTLAADPSWVHARFERAVDIIQSLPKSGPIQTNYDDKLLLYSVYKQATEGDIKTSRPGMFDVLGRAKWDAWNKRKGLSAQDAERMYAEALIRVLRGYSDRTQAAELLRELETFSLEPRRAAVAAGSFAPSQIVSHSGSSSSTASYDDRPAIPPSSYSRSHLTPTQPQSQSQHPSSARQSRTRAPAPPFPPPDVVAPPLLGYGPPRTRADSVRRGGKSQGRRGPARDRYHEETEEEEGSSDYSTGEAEDEEEDLTGSFHHAVPRPPALGSAARREQPIPQPPQLRHFPPSSLRSIAGGSPAPSITAAHSAHQHIAIAYPAGYVPPPTAIAPLTSSNLLQRSTHSAAATTSPAAPAPVSAPGGLDAALDRIQLSLTALHERLTVLESSSRTTTSPTSSSSAFPLWRETFLRLLAFLHVRPSPFPSTTTSTTTTSSSLPALLVRLLLSLIGTARRVAGDAAVVVAVVVLLGRMRGVDIVGAMGRWFVQYLVGRDAARSRRVET
ncbi:hypothetical protein JCM21900_001195 [Sporobolomyces salmonicolor]